MYATGFSMQEIRIFLDNCQRLETITSTGTLNIPLTWETDISDCYLNNFYLIDDSTSHLISLKPVFSLNVWEFLPLTTHAVCFNSSSSSGTACVFRNSFEEYFWGKWWTQVQNGTVQFTVQQRMVVNNSILNLAPNRASAANALWCLKVGPRPIPKRHPDADARCVYTLRCQPLSEIRKWLPWFQH